MSFTLVMDAKKFELLLEALGITAGVLKTAKLPAEHRPEEFLQLSEELIEQAQGRVLKV
jgi:hypothetical protein